MCSWIKATVFFAQVLAKVCDVEEFFWVEVGVIVGRQNNVWTSACVGGNSCFGSNVFPTFVVNAHFYASGICEFFDVDHVGVDVALHKTAPAQDAQLSAFFGLKAHILGLGRRCKAQSTCA